MSKIKSSDFKPLIKDKWPIKKVKIRKMKGGGKNWLKNTMK